MPPAKDASGHRLLQPLATLNLPRTLIFFPGEKIFARACEIAGECSPDPLESKPSVLDSLTVKQTGSIALAGPALGAPAMHRPAPDARR